MRAYLFDCGNARNPTTKVFGKYLFAPKLPQAPLKSDRHDFGLALMRLPDKMLIPFGTSFARFTQS